MDSPVQKKLQGYLSSLRHQAAGRLPVGEQAHTCIKVNNCVGPVCPDRNSPQKNHNHLSSAINEQALT